MTGKKYRDEVDNFLSDINFAASDPYRQTKSDELTTYSVFNKEDLKPRVMTNEEWYDFRRTTATLFNEKVTKNWKYIDESINKLNNLDDDKKILEKRLLVGSLMTQSRQEAILEVNKKLGLSEKQIDKIKEREEMKDAKKEYKIDKIKDRIESGR
jgi:chaperonin cofactor prefoldin